MAFPSIWVSYNAVFWNASCWTMIATQYNVSPSFLVCFLHPESHTMLSSHSCSLFVSCLVSYSVLNSLWVTLAWLFAFGIITWPSLCAQQSVSAPCWFGFFLCLDFSLNTWQSVSALYSLGFFSCPNLSSYAWQLVSVPYSASVFRCPDLSVPSTALDRMWVSLFA
jgi:hypothetical protein